MNDYLPSVYGLSVFTVPPEKPAVGLIVAFLQLDLIFFFFLLSLQFVSLSLVFFSFPIIYLAVIFFFFVGLLASWLCGLVVFIINFGKIFSQLYKYCFCLIPSLFYIEDSIKRNTFHFLIYSIPFALSSQIFFLFIFFLNDHLVQWFSFQPHLIGY